MEILGHLSKRIIIGFIENKAHNGDAKLNPLDSKNFNTCYLYLDGEQVNFKPVQPDFKNTKMYVDAYHTLFSSTNVHFSNTKNLISRDT